MKVICICFYIYVATSIFNPSNHVNDFFNRFGLSTNMSLAIIANSGPTPRTTPTETPKTSINLSCTNIPAANEIS